MELVGRIPVARNDDIDVTIPRDATPASHTDLEGESGVLMWTMDIEPKRTESVRHYFDMSYPADRSVRYR